MTPGIPSAVLEQLSQVPLFAACSRRDLRAIATLGTQLELRAGSVLTTEGEPGSEFFLVRAGAARCVRNGRKVATFGPGDFFGETALLTNAPRTATVTVVSDMTVIVFSRREFSSLLNSSPQIARKLLKALAEREGKSESHSRPTVTV
ncbi:MAG TPA: cyclic nucleotide-binding domain-containing protein [Acidimicrobiales bacterium]|nr:cyclic nucleotide-binding domain-containing protein [Acidimicrobiales bacterium]